MSTFEQGMKLTRGKPKVKLAVARDGWAFIVEVRDPNKLPPALAKAFAGASRAFFADEKRGRS